MVVLFYFVDQEGNELRVSDHPLTGKRAFNTIEISILPEITQERKDFFNPLKIRKSYLEGKITKEEYKIICKERGFVFKP